MGPQTAQNPKNRNQKMTNKSVEKIVSGPIVAAIYSEARIEGGEMMKDKPKNIFSIKH